MLGKTFFIVSLLFLGFNIGHSQNIAVADTSDRLVKTFDSLVKATIGLNYSVGDVLDVDDRITNASYRVYQDIGLIFEDPHHQLEHCYIVVLYSLDENSYWVNDSGAVAIIRDNQMVWHSRFLVRNMGGGMPLPGFADINHDGTTDILVLTPQDERGYSERLWIISPDSSGGRLLNAVDSHGESIITGASGTFTFSTPSSNGPKIIKANELGGGLNRFLEYNWNGAAFVKAKSAKSSRKH